MVTWITPSGIRGGGFHRQFEGVQGVAGIPAGHVDQVSARIRVQHDLARAVAAFLVRQGHIQDLAGLFAGQRQQLENPAARDQRADHLEIGVLGGGADQHEGAVFDMRQQGILLGLVPAVDFVHEQDGFLLVHAPALEGGIDDILQFGLAGQHRRKGLEMGLGLVGDDLGQGGLAGAGRPPQDDGREQPVGLDGAPQQLAGADDLLLPDELVQRARAHAGGQRGLGIHAFLHGMVEEVGHGLIVPFGGGESREREQRAGNRNQVLKLVFVPRNERRNE